MLVEYIIGFSVWVVVGLTVCKICPILEITNDLPENVTAQNNVYKIKIREELDNWVGVLARALYESKLKQNLIHSVQRILFKDEALERGIEIMGHEITVQFLPKEEQHIARLKHATTLRDYHDLFDGWAIDVIYECMLEETPYAQEWIADNINKITDLERKRYE